MKIKNWAFFLLTSLTITGCTSASQRESNTTWKNHQVIETEIPTPTMNFSQRRFALAKFYEMLNVRYLPTCTIVTEGPQIAYYDTVGPSVNLSNQMTSPGMAEPDSVHVGTNDQTVSITQNNKGTITEQKTMSITNARCPKEPNLNFQQVVTAAIASQKEIELDLLKGVNSPTRQTPAPVTPTVTPKPPKP